MPVQEKLQFFFGLELWSGAVSAHRPVGKPLNGFVRFGVGLDQEGLGLWSDGAQIEGAHVALGLEISDDLAEFDTEFDGVPNGGGPDIIGQLDPKDVTRKTKESRKWD